MCKNYLVYEIMLCCYYHDLIYSSHKLYDFKSLFISTKWLASLFNFHVLEANLLHLGSEVVTNLLSLVGVVYFE